MKIYTIKIEGEVPATFIYNISAENAEEALEKAKRLQPNSIDYKLSRKILRKATVYEYGSSIIRLIRNLLKI